MWDKEEILTEILKYYELKWKYKSSKCVGCSEENAYGEKHKRSSTGFIV